MQTDKLSTAKTDLLKRNFGNPSMLTSETVEVFYLSNQLLSVFKQDKFASFPVSDETICQELHKLVLTSDLSLLLHLKVQNDLVEEQQLKLSQLEWELHDLHKKVNSLEWRTE